MTPELNFDNWKRKFLLIYTGQAFSIISSSAVNFAITTYLTLQYQSAEVLAFAFIAGFLPMAIIGPFSWVFIDRWNKKYTMIFADTFVALCTLVMALLFIFGHENLLIIYTLMALRSIGSAFHFPAMQASVPLLAPQSEFMRVAGMNQVIQSISSIAGPALGGFLIALFPIGPILFLDIFGAVMAISFLSFVKFPNISKQKIEHSISGIFREMKEGWDTIISIPAVKWSFIYGVFVLFALFPLVSLLPLMTTSYFGGSTAELAYTEIGYSIGMLAGGLLLSIWKPKMHAMLIASIAIVIFGITFGIGGILPQNMNGLYIFIVLIAISGIIGSIEQSAISAFMQTKVPQEKLGRVMSLNFSVQTLPSMIGLVGIGFLTEKLGGVNNVFILLGIFLIIVWMMQYFTPAIRNTILEDSKQ